MFEEVRENVKISSSLYENSGLYKLVLFDSTKVNVIHMSMQLEEHAYLFVRTAVHYCC